MGLERKLGALYRASWIFARLWIDIVKVEFRPVKNKPQEHRFLVKFDSRVQIEKSPKS